MTTKQWCEADGYECLGDPYLPRHKVYVWKEKRLVVSDMMFPLLQRRGIEVVLAYALNGGGIIEGRWGWIAWEYFKR